MCASVAARCQVYGQRRLVNVIDVQLASSISLAVRVPSMQDPPPSCMQLVGFCHCAEMNDSVGCLQLEGPGGTLDTCSGRQVAQSQPGLPA